MQTALGAPAGALLFRRVTASLANVPWDDDLARKGVLAFGVGYLFKVWPRTGVDFSHT